MRCPADHMLISRRSFLFTLEHVNIRMKELFCFEGAPSFVHSKKYMNYYKTIKKNWIKHEITYLYFKWEP